MGKIISFGEYPQTAKASWVTVSAVKDARGYYKGSDGYYYARTDSGAYFKVEPIKWQVLSEKNGEALLLSERVLDSETFARYSNNYETSVVRSFLNKEFFDAAFTASEKGRVLVTNVDNSAESTGEVPCCYACKNTSDRVFLLSVKEATSPAYGFPASDGMCAERRREPTDYASEMGAYSAWILRSPDAVYGERIRYVHRSGNISVYRSHGGFDGYGILPALRIRL